MSILFPDGIMDTWPYQPQHKKDAVIEALHYEYIRVVTGHDFDTKYMLKHMCNVLKHRCSKIKDALHAQKAKPKQVDKSDWDYAKRELRDNPTRWEQQKKAK